MPDHRRGAFLISTDPARLDVKAIHAFLSRSYWAEGIPEEVVARSLRHSLCFGVYEGEDHLRRWSLVTWDAHGLYRKLGFEKLRRPERHMELVRTDAYKTPDQA